MCLELVRIIPLECLSEENTNLNQSSVEQLKNIINNKNDMLEINSETKKKFLEVYQNQSKTDKQNQRYSKEKYSGINSIKSFMSIERNKRGDWL